LLNSQFSSKSNLTSGTETPYIARVVGRAVGFHGSLGRGPHPATFFLLDSAEQGTGPMSRRRGTSQSVAVGGGQVAAKVLGERGNVLMAVKRTDEATK